MALDELRDLIDRHARPDMSTPIEGVLIARHDVSALESSMSGSVMALIAPVSTWFRRSTCRSPASSSTPVPNARRWASACCSIRPAWPNCCSRRRRPTFATAGAARRAG